MAQRSKKRAGEPCTFCTVVEGGRSLDHCPCGHATGGIQAKAWVLTYVGSREIREDRLVQYVRGAVQDRLDCYCFPSTRIVMCGGRAVNRKNSGEKVTVRLIVVMDYAMSWPFLRDVLCFPYRGSEEGELRRASVSRVRAAVAPSLCDWQYIFLSIAETVSNNVCITLCGEWMNVASILDGSYCCECRQGLVAFLYESSLLGRQDVT